MQTHFYAKPEISARNNRKSIEGSVFYVVRAMPIAGQFANVQAF
jgi:hypothetical protein